MILNIREARESKRMLGVSNYCKIAFGSEEVAQEFHDWAFGKGSRGKKIDQYPKFWNEKHADLFVVDSNNIFLDDLDKMMYCFIAQKCNEDVI